MGIVFDHSRVIKISWKGLHNVLGDLTNSLANDQVKRHKLILARGIHPTLTSVVIFSIMMSLVRTSATAFPA